MLQISFTPFPELFTERLVLRQMNVNDGHDLFLLRSNKEIMRYIPRTLASSAEDAAAYIRDKNEGAARGDEITWGITLDGQVIGTIGYIRIMKERHRAEVGYLLDLAYHRKGIMQEAFTAVINYGFQVMKLHSIEAIVDPKNDASALLLQKNSFIREAYFKDYAFFQGIYIDSVVYSRLAPL